MLKIGDFSSLAQVSIKTLRYYDERGLLSPVHIDPETGYRYYSASQLSRLHRILALKDFGFSLEQIAICLEETLTAEQMRGMLLLRQAEQRVRVEEEHDRLGRLQSRIRLRRPCHRKWFSNSCRRNGSRPCGKRSLTIPRWARFIRR